MLVKYSFRHTWVCINVFSGCNLEHGYCTKPDECICHVGWKGSNCTECVVQPNCPGGCSTPACCVCSNPSDNTGICKIKNIPPKLTKSQLPYTMDHTCVLHNIIQKEVPPMPEHIIVVNPFEIETTPMVESSTKSSKSLATPTLPNTFTKSVTEGRNISKSVLYI